MKPGVYTMQVSIDTRSELGVLIAKRKVTILSKTAAVKGTGGCGCGCSGG